MAGRRSEGFELNRIAAGVKRVATELGLISPVQTQLKKFIVLPTIEHVKRDSVEQLMQK